MNRPTIDIGDLYVILFSGSTRAEAIAIEFDTSKRYILMPNYRLN